MYDRTKLLQAVSIIAELPLDLETKTVPGDPLVDALIMTARAIVDKDRKVVVEADAYLQTR